MPRLKNETLVKSRGASERERERERVVISRTRVLSPQRVGFRAFSKSEVSDRSREIRLNFLSSASSLFLSFLSFALFGGRRRRRGRVERRLLRRSPDALYMYIYIHIKRVNRRAYLAQQLFSSDICVVCTGVP